MFSKLKQKTVNLGRNYFHVLMLMPFLLVTNTAHASALQKLIQVLDEWQVDLIVLVGTIGVFYVIWLSIQAKSGNKRWNDVVWGIVHVVFVGSLPSLVSWAYKFYAGA